MEKIHSLELLAIAWLILSLQLKGNLKMFCAGVGLAKLAEIVFTNIANLYN